MKRSSYLSDDGTMDTVIVCGECGREHRFNFDGPIEDQTPRQIEAAYQAWVDECFDEVDADCDHVCVVGKPMIHNWYCDCGHDRANHEHVLGSECRVCSCVAFTPAPKSPFGGANLLGPYKDAVYCHACGRRMSAREASEQGVCNDCQTA